jgi:hypothetical protein
VTNDQLEIIERCLEEICKAQNFTASKLCPPGPPVQDAAGEHVLSVAEAIMGVTQMLSNINDSISDLNESLESIISLAKEPIK